jgi:hypothetical protein
MAIEVHPVHQALGLPPVISLHCNLQTYSWKVRPDLNEIGQIPDFG